MFQNTDEAKRALNALSDELDEIEKAKNKSINVFEASGMRVQEVKHSAFFAWLLDPNKPHKLGNAVLKRFCESVLNYENTFGGKSNREIIGENFSRFEEFVSDNKIEVTTERVVVNKNSRTDVFVSSAVARTVLVIENKVFTTMHDDQLNRYKEELTVHGEYRNYNKILVYLTPNGDSPMDNDWCAFDYGAIVKIMDEVCRDLPKAKEYAKLKILMEDYIELVETDILNDNKELRRLCKDIKRKHAEALEILAAYTDNVDMVYEYIGQEWLPNNVDNIANKYFNGRRLYFCTQPIVDYYSRHGRRIEIDPTRYVFQISVISKDGPISIIMGLNKNVDEEWRAEDIAVRDILMSDKKMGDKYCTLHSVLLLNEDDRGKNFDEVKTTVDEKLTAFFAKVKELERELDRR